MENKNEKKTNKNNHLIHKPISGIRKGSKQNKFFKQKIYSTEDNINNINNYNRHSNLSGINNNYYELIQNKNNKNKIYENQINKKKYLISQKNKKQKKEGNIPYLNNFIKFNDFHSNLIARLRNKLPNYKEQYLNSKIRLTNDININNSNDNLLNRFRPKSCNRTKYKTRLNKKDFDKNIIKHLNSFRSNNKRIPALINIDLTKLDKYEIKKNINNNIHNSKNNNMMENKKSSSQKEREIISVNINLNDIIEKKNEKTNNNNNIKDKNHKEEKREELKEIINNNNNENYIYKSYAFDENPNKEYRDSMEDFHDFKNLSINNFIFHYFSIFDGHNGKEVSLYLKENFHKFLETELKQISFTEDYNQNKEKIISSIKTSFEKMDNDIINNKSIKDDIGSTGTIFLLYRDPYDTSKKVLICANVGDSKGFLINKENITQITQDHICNNISEVERIKKEGGVVFQGRVFGTLMLTRSFGDKEMKQYGVLESPYIYSCFLDKNNLYVIMASDGVWDVVNSDEIFGLSKMNNISCEEFSKKIILKAIDKGTTDNVTCLVVKF